eukprot:SAG31_NODE_5603_length_2426_cov_4.864633_3_plen_185_part_01
MSGAVLESTAISNLTGMGVTPEKKRSKKKDKQTAKKPKSQRKKNKKESEAVSDDGATISKEQKSKKKPKKDKAKKGKKKGSAPTAVSQLEISGSNDGPQTYWMPGSALTSGDQMSVDGTGPDSDVADGGMPPDSQEVQPPSPVDADSGRSPGTEPGVSLGSETAVQETAQEYWMPGCAVGQEGEQ